MTSHRDSGFGIVELLVALTIAAAIVVGIGALFGALTGLRERTEESAAVTTALVDLEALASLTGEEVGQTVADVSATGFRLERVQAGSAEPVTTGDLTLRQGSDRRALEFGRGALLTSADLTVFEQVSLEYFVPDTQGEPWRDWQDLDSNKIAAVRLVLGLGARTWRPLIWAGDIYR